MCLQMPEPLTYLIYHSNHLFFRCSFSSAFWICFVLVLWFKTDRFTKTAKFGQMLRIFSLNGSIKGISIPYVVLILINFQLLTGILELSWKFLRLWFFRQTFYHLCAIPLHSLPQSHVGVNVKQKDGADWFPPSFVKGFLVICLFNFQN